LLIVHGALGSAEQMAPLAAAIRDALPELTVQVVELPGHGATPLAGRPFSMATFTAAVTAASATAPALPPLVFGYSMGGYVALLHEATHPGAFAGIVTLGTMLDWSPAVAAGAAARLDPVVLAAKVPAFAAQLAERHAASGGWEAMMTNTASLLRTLGEAPPLHADTLALVACPVQLLVGARDDTTSFASTAQWATHVPRGTATELADVPHPIEKVPAAPIIAALRALLNTVA
jgi:pimeloyl-ACP methyl ester carboxylesterase